MDAHDEMIAAQRGDEPHISPSELNAGLGVMMNKTMSMDEFIAWRKSQLSSDVLRCQSKECIDEEPLKVLFLQRRVGTFSFQCNCGAKHQFHYSGNKKGFRLEVKTS